MAPVSENRVNMFLARTNLAMSLRDRRRTTEAEAAVQEALKEFRSLEAEDPRAARELPVDVVRLLSNLYSFAHDHRSEIAVLEKCLDRATAEDTLHQYRSCHDLVYALADCPDPAVLDRRRAIELARMTTTLKMEAPVEARMHPWRLLGFALACDGQWQEALAAYAKAREMGDVGHGGIIYEALVQAHVGNAKEAGVLYEKALALTQTHFARETALRRCDEVAALLGLPGGR